MGAAVILSTGAGNRFPGNPFRHPDHPAYTKGTDRTVGPYVNTTEQMIELSETKTFFFEIHHRREQNLFKETLCQKSKNPLKYEQHTLQ